MPLFFVSPKAERDIEDITTFIARDNSTRALGFAKELRAKMTEVAKSPELYRERSELRAGLRAARHKHYLIFFRFAGERIEILRVWHSARDQNDLFEAD
jgi:toxin ParE1/3/4